MELSQLYIFVVVFFIPTENKEPKQPGSEDGGEWEFQ